MSDFPEKAEDKVNTLGLVAIGLATTAMCWASVVALQGYFLNTEGEMAAERAATGLSTEMRDLDLKQLADLSKTTYADPKKGTLKRLAIEHAKAAVVADAKANAPSLIPSLGLLNVNSFPPRPGKPADNPEMEAPAPVPPAPGAEAVDGQPVEAPPVEGATAVPAAPAPAGANP